MNNLTVGLLVLYIAHQAGCREKPPGFPESKDIIVARVNCGPLGCGTNTPEIMPNSPLGTIHLGSRDGVFKPNKNCIRLVSGSLKTPRCKISDRRELKLGVIGGKFVALQGGLPKCKEAQMLGATFRLERLPRWVQRKEDRRPERCVSKAHPVESWTLKIERSALIPKFAIIGTNRADPAAYSFSPAYELVVLPKAREGSQEGRIPRDELLLPASLREHSGERHLCPNALPWGFDFQHLGVKKLLNDPTVQDLTKAGHFAVLLRDEFYNDNPVYVTRVRASRNWLTLGCSGTALSKMVLLGKGPHSYQEEDGPAVRKATLKMLSANYCALLKGTAPGTPVHWADNQSTTFVGTPSEPQVPEALWGPEGAICLDHLRIFRENEAPPNDTKWVFGQPLPDDEADALQAVYDYCGLEPCENTAADTEAWYWRTRAPGHRAH